MKVIKIAVALGLAALVSACAGANDTARLQHVDPPAAGIDVVSFTDPTEIDPAAAPVPGQSLPPLNVQSMTIVVPDVLDVSEANRYLPAGDIVWREDPPGDRRTQVRAIFETAFATGTETMTEGTPVSLYVQVMRFHALTEKARYSVGGVHSIKFGLAVRDLNTGRLVGAPRIVEADLNAFGGRAALAAERKGLTQKSRITAHLAQVIQDELTKSEGHQNAKLGLIQQLNKF